LVRPDVSRCFPIGPQSRSYSESDDVPIFGICIVLAVRGFQRQIQKCGGAHRCAVSRWVGDRTNPQFRCRWATIVSVARLPVRRTHSGSYRLLGLQASGITWRQICRFLTFMHKGKLVITSDLRIISAFFLEKSSQHSAHDFPPLSSAACSGSRIARLRPHLNEGASVVLPSLRSTAREGADAIPAP
jgi:hypothetical protein